MIKKQQKLKTNTEDSVLSGEDAQGLRRQLSASVKSPKERQPISFRKQQASNLELKTSRSQNSSLNAKASSQPLDPNAQRKPSQNQSVDQ